MPLTVDSELVRKIAEDIRKRFDEQKLHFFELLLLNSDSEFRVAGLELESEQHRRALTEVVKNTYERTLHQVTNEPNYADNVFQKAAESYIKYGMKGLLI